jgi:hypothetical protein
MENIEKSNIWVWALVIVGILVIVIFFSYQKKEQDIAPVVVAPIVEPIVVEPESVEDIVLGSKAVSMSYADALVKYADRRIQLDKNCQAFPNTVTYKDNTGIMIDNRSPQTRTVKVGTTVTIKGYGFKIITLPDVYLSTKTILIDCDGSQNVATILVQE